METPASAEPYIGYTRKSRRFALLTLLLLGWGGLFTYSAAYLNEDLPFRPRSGQVVGEPQIDEIEDVSRQVIKVSAPEASPPTAVLATAMPSTLQTPASQPAEPPATLRLAATSVDYVGTWGPTAGACGAPSGRKGFFQATITPERAKAGDTICSFRDAHRTGNAWTMAADCGDRDRRWSSHVRLIVEGDRLTWKSAWGTSAYVRCNRRTG